MNRIIIIEYRNISRYIRTVHVSFRRSVIMPFANSFVPSSSSGIRKMTAQKGREAVPINFRSGDVLLGLPNSTSWKTQTLAITGSKSAGSLEALYFFKVESLIRHSTRSLPLPGVILHGLATPYVSPRGTALWLISFRLEICFQSVRQTMGSIAVNSKGSHVSSKRFFEIFWFSALLTLVYFLAWKSSVASQ